jgi:DNA repair ATPase RecN
MEDKKPECYYCYFCHNNYCHVNPKSVLLGNRNEPCQFFRWRNEPDETTKLQKQVEELIARCDGELCVSKETLVATQAERDEALQKIGRYESSLQDASARLSHRNERIKELEKELEKAHQGVKDWAVLYNKQTEELKTAQKEIENLKTSHDQYG